MPPTPSEEERVPVSFQEYMQRERERGRETKGTELLTGCPPAPRRPLTCHPSCHTVVLNICSYNYTIICKQSFLGQIKRRMRVDDGELVERAGGRPNFWWFYPALLSRGRNWANEAEHSHLRCTPPRALCLRMFNSNSSRITGFMWLQ